MLAMKREKEFTNRKPSRYEVGDRVITSNCRLGTVIRLDRDEQGEFVVVNLDVLPGEFAYDPWDLEKVV